MTKITAKVPATKLAHRRLSVLELSQELGSVSKACRQAGMDRTSFYEWKRRFQTHGLEGLKDLPPVHKDHPQTTPEGTVQKVLALSQRHPTRGCNFLAAQLALEGVSLSAVTVQNILSKSGLGGRYERLLALEKTAVEQGMELTAEQVALIEQANPVFKERHVESSRPGELLCQDTFYVGQLKGVGKVYLHSLKVYLHSLVDTYGSVAFGFLHTGKQPEAAVSLLHNDVLPFYAQREIPVSKVLTDNGREFCPNTFCGTESHPFELYLALNDIRHKKTKVRTPRTNGFVERWHRTVLDEFFRQAFRTKLYASVEELQADLDAWLLYYNAERPHLGYRNMGRRPLDTVAEFLALPDWRERCLAPTKPETVRQEG